MNLGLSNKKRKKEKKMVVVEFMAKTERVMEKN